MGARGQGLTAERWGMIEILLSVLIITLIFDIVERKRLRDEMVRQYMERLKAAVEPETSKLFKHEDMDFIATNDGGVRITGVR